MTNPISFVVSNDVQVPTGMPVTHPMCVECWVGWYQPDKGQSTCHECPQGYYCKVMNIIIFTEHCKHVRVLIV